MKKLKDLKLAALKDMLSKDEMKKITGGYGGGGGNNCTYTVTCYTQLGAPLFQYPSGDSCASLPSVYIAKCKDVYHYYSTTWAGCAC